MFFSKPSILLYLLATASASPTPSADNEQGTASIQLNHNHAYHQRRTSDELAVRQAWLLNESHNLRMKYSQLLDANSTELLTRDLRKRQNPEGQLGQEQMMDIGLDASYTGTVYVGTPAQKFEVILDTGSADLWLADTQCTSSTCQGITTFNEGASSSFRNLGTPFRIVYGSGEASGTLATDTVTMAGYTVNPQTYALVMSASDDLLMTPYSGLMGLGWTRLASSGATPLWEALASGGQLATPLMSFYMARYRGLATATRIEENGGLMTLGYLNNSLYTGEINYVSIDQSARDYWRIPVAGFRAGSTAITITSSSGGSPNAAIDTGTTLIGAPTSVVNATYGAIAGARPMSLTGYEGYWEYPCSTIPNIQMQFGSVRYAISDADFNLGPFTRDYNYCTGALFAQDLSSQSPISWIVGATFLKNVYSVFSYSPTAIGFATLAGNAGSATTASAGSTAVPTSRTSASTGSGAAIKSMGWSGGLATVGIAASMLIGSALVR